MHASQRPPAIYGWYLAPDRRGAMHAPRRPLESFCVDQFLSKVKLIDRSLQRAGTTGALGSGQRTMAVNSVPIGALSVQR